MSCCSHNKSSCNGHHHHHHHHQQSNCCCQSSCCGCSCCAEESCCHEEEECCTKSEKLLEIANLAWVEVLKDKIKEHILANDKKIDELAKIVAEANHRRWKQKIENEKCCSNYDQCCEDFEEQLCKIFSCGDSCHTENKKK